MEPILIKANEREINASMSRVKAACELLSPLVEKIQDVCDLDISGELGSEVLQANECPKVEAALIQKINDDLHKAGIKIKSIHDAAINQSKEDFYKIFREIYNKRSTYSTLLGFLEVHDKKLRVSPEAEKIIREQNSTYVRTEAGKKLMDAHNEFYQAAEKFFNVMPQHFKDISQAYTISFPGGDFGAKKVIEKANWDCDYVAGADTRFF